MALAGELAKYVGKELVKSSGKELAKAGAKSALSSLVPSVATKVGTDLATKAGNGVLRNILVNKVAQDTSPYVPVVVNGKVSLNNLPGYSEGNNLSLRHISNKELPDLGVSDLSHQHGGVLYASQKGAKIPVVKGKNVYFGRLDNAKVLDLTDEDTALALSKAYKYNLEKSGAFGNSASPSAEIANQVNQIQNGITGSINRGDILNNLIGGDMVLKGNSDVATETAPEFVLTNNDMVQRANFQPGYKVPDTVKKYLPEKPKYGLDEYGMGTIDLRDMNTPKVQQSLVDEPKIIYHGTPNKFEDFDESLPSVWFSDSNKNLKDTGLTMKGSNDINVMERMLPRDLKIADEELADKLTKQQLQDRGYAGIAYTERGPNGDETYYEIFKPNKTLKKMPKVSQSLDYGGYGSYDENVKRVGSSAVAPVREETLPEGWKELEKYMDTSNDRLSLAIGKPRSKITKQDLINFLEDYGYDTEGTKDDLWKNALMCIDDMAMDDLYNAGGSAGQFLMNRLPFRHNDKLTDATNYYIGAKGRTGRLDAEYSDRLGIGRSNTPMSDRLVNPYSGAGGDYSQGAFGTDPTWATGESGVSTSAHERMHAWQDINKFDWDEEVGDAIDELRGELKKFYHDEDTIKKYWGNSKTDYYMEDIEQEARMLQSYLDNEGYTNTYRKTSEKGTEWGDEIKPAFDRFFKKLRALSKKGIALPAVAGLVGIGALAGKKDNKSIDNIE